MSKYFSAYNQSEALFAVTYNRYIVGSINQNGEFSISKIPALHTTAQAAKTEANRLAGRNVGTAYVVLKLDSACLAGGMQEF